MSANASRSSSKPVDVTPKSFKDLQQPFANTLRGLLDQYNSSNAGSNLVSGYTGPTAAPISSGEQAGLAQTQGLANNIGSGNAGNVNTQADKNVNNALTQAGASTGNIADYANALMGANKNPTSSLTSSNFLADLNGASGGVFSTDNNNPFLQAAIQAAQRPTLEGLTQTLTRDLPGRFTQAGQFVQPGSSSAFDRAAAIATRGTANALGDIATNMSYSNYNDAAARAAAALGQYTTGQQQANSQTQQLTAEQQQQAVSNSLAAQNQNNQNATTASTVQGQDINNSIANLQAQALPRLIQDLGIERGTEAFNNNINSILAGLGIASGVTRPVVANSSSSSSGGFGLK